jgi:hypothetical protein
MTFCHNDSLNFDQNNQQFKNSEYIMICKRKAKKDHVLIDYIEKKIA